MQVSKEAVALHESALKSAGLEHIKMSDEQRKFGALLVQSQAAFNKSNKAIVESAFGTMNENTLALGQTANISTFSDVLIGMTSRMAPSLAVTMAFAGVQPMNLPDGNIFGIRARYDSRTGAEAWATEPNSAFGGVGTQSSGDVAFGTVTHGTAAPTATGEGWGVTTGGSAWSAMTFTIEKQLVTAQTRGITTSITAEMREDLRRVHGMDAEVILGNMVTTEITAGINREYVRTLMKCAKVGAPDTVTPGTFDLVLDANGITTQQHAQSLIFQIELDAIAIGQDTRIGQGNRVLVSPRVAALLRQSGEQGLTTNNQSDNRLISSNPLGDGYVGRLTNGMDVYVDHYANATFDYYIVGYKGNEFQAGIYYCPYTPIEVYRTVASDSFHNQMGFKTRYGKAANQFMHQDAAGNVAAGGGLGTTENGFYRKVLVTSISS